MAKKSKRPPARKQQRPQQRPLQPRQSLPLAEMNTSRPAVEPVPEEQEDFAATALPYVESDGPMPLPPPENEPAEAPAQVTVTTGGTQPGERRRIGRVDPTAAAARQQQRVKSGRQPSTAAMFEPLPPDDAAIPFDRVPYVPGDLRRVMIIAALMVVLVVVADVVINAVVK
jgi:hypothetical protein